MNSSNNTKPFEFISFTSNKMLSISLTLVFVLIFLFIHSALNNRIRSHCVCVLEVNKKMCYYYITTAKWKQQTMAINDRIKHSIYDTLMSGYAIASLFLF